MTLSGFTNEQLQIELDARNKVEEEARKRPPEPLVIPELSGLLDACEKYIKFVSEGYHGFETERDHYVIFKAALKAIYGESVWDWITKNTRP